MGVSVFATAWLATSDRWPDCRCSPVCRRSWRPRGTVGDGNFDSSGSASHALRWNSEEIAAQTGVTLSLST